MSNHLLSLSRFTLGVLWGRLRGRAAFALLVVGAFLAWLDYAPVLVGLDLGGLTTSRGWLSAFEIHPIRPLWPLMVPLLIVGSGCSSNPLKCS
ncbi:hypothetical protein F4860DRAFT_140059 [Xylaria cubensis]|nr:hypothetical protein F4860DRAFT_140059 [Xylaria cubensis]